MRRANWPLKNVHNRRVARNGRSKPEGPAGGARIGRSSLLGLYLSILVLFLSFFISLNLFDRPRGYIYIYIYIYRNTYVYTVLMRIKITRSFHEQ